MYATRSLLPTDLVNDDASKVPVSCSQNGSHKLPKTNWRARSVHLQVTANHRFTFTYLHIYFRKWWHITINCSVIFWQQTRPQLPNFSRQQKTLLGGYIVICTGNQLCRPRTAASVTCAYRAFKYLYFSIQFRWTCFGVSLRGPRTLNLGMLNEVRIFELRKKYCSYKRTKSLLGSRHYLYIICML